MPKQAKQEVENNTVNDISDAEVVKKYKQAAQVINSVLKQALAKAVVGASIVNICQESDNEILKQLNEVCGDKATYKKGISFPTCLSLNGVLAHFSPLNGADKKLEDGDLAKLEMGAHVDGYIAIAAHSFVVGATKEKPATGKKADVVLAAYYAAEAAIRSLKKGVKGGEVADNVKKATQQYECVPVENMLFYRMDQHKIEGDEGILINGTYEGRRDHKQPEIKLHDVYAVDALVTTGKGTARITEMETSIFKLEAMRYNLKSKRSRQFLAYAHQTYGNMPFNIRYFETDDDNNSPAKTVFPTPKGGKADIPVFVTAKLGIKECREHGMMTSFDVQQVEQSEQVAQFKYTVFVTDQGVERITELPEFDLACYNSTHEVKDEALKTLLSGNDGENKKAAAEEPKPAAN